MEEPTEMHRDVKSGKMINPHNPEFITKRPWYLGESGPSLTHHTAASDHALTLAETDAAVAAARASRAVEVGTWVEALYRGRTPWLPAKVEAVRLDGSLELSFENGKRAKAPRSQVKLPRGARAKLDNLSYDAKRDRWHGYDPGMHSETVDKYAALDAERARARQDADFELSEDQQKDFQGRVARQGGLGGAQMKTTVRNLRIREDTAKYLRNLDPNSAYYDPKSRAMRENPTPHIDPKDLVYAGDNFARATGEALDLAKTQIFAWDVEREGAAAGSDLVHVQADPSRAELLRKKNDLQREAMDACRRAALLDKYGDASTSETVEEKHLRVKPHDTYHPVNAVKLPASTKYQEDVFVNNHTSVWGSYFCTRTFSWGYADDHSLVRNSYSTGEKGKIANDRANAQLPLHHDDRQDLPTAKRPKAAVVPRSQLFGVPDKHHEFDEAKVADHLQRQKRQAQQQQQQGDTYNSLTATTEVTPEEMEAYRRSKVAANDPMAKFLKDSFQPAQPTTDDHEPRDP